MHEVAASSALLVVAAAGARPPRPRCPARPFRISRSAAALAEACDKRLAQRSGGRLRRLERRPADRRWLGAYDEINARARRLAGPIYLLSNVHPDKADARCGAKPANCAGSDFNSSLGQNEALYAALRKLEPRDAIDRELRKTTLESFVDSGVGLPPAERARAKAITDRIAALGQTFDATSATPTSSCLHRGRAAGRAGRRVWKGAKRDAEGRVLLGLDYPVYVPVMQGAPTPATRERMWLAKTNEGGEANLKLLGEIAQLRKEYAAAVRHCRAAPTSCCAGAWRENTASARALSRRRTVGGAGARDARARELRAGQGARSADSRWPTSGSSAGTSLLHRARCGASATASTRRHSAQYFPPRARAWHSSCA